MMNIVIVCARPQALMRPYVVITAHAACNVYVAVQFSHKLLIGAHLVPRQLLAMFLTRSEYDR